MSTTLVAVFIPLGFMGGLTGILFIEFAFTLSAAVILSGVVALTLSPMMCSRILRSRTEAHRRAKLQAWLDSRFSRLREGYHRRLSGALGTQPWLLTLAAIVLRSEQHTSELPS